MKTIVLLQHFKTTKLGYSCILYPCLYWCVELELVGCRAAKLVMVPDLLSYGLWNYNFTGYLNNRRTELLTKPYSRSFCILAVTYKVWKNLNILLARMMKMNIRHIRNFLNNFHSQTNKRVNFITSQPLRQCMYNRQGGYIVFALYYHHIVFL